MAGFDFTRLHPPFVWLWRRVSLLWRFMAAKCYLVARYVLAIRWQDNPGRRQNERDYFPPAEDIEAQREAGVSAERPPAWDQEPCLVSKAEEDSDEGHNNELGQVEGGHDEVEIENDDDDDEEEEESDSETYWVETTDELYCGYDSTWETKETPPKRARCTRAPRPFKFQRFENAARDMQNYRHNYPNRSQDWENPVSDGKPNLDFYLGYKPSVPDKAYIHDFHNKWAGAYDALEYVHTYIQWLFPLQEQGVNYSATPLTKKEIECFLENRTAKENLLKSYKLMLDFYGIKLRNEQTGKVGRASNWIDRFNNLNDHTHNNLRITRILKCLGTLGYDHYQAPLVRFFLEETLVHGELPNVRESVLNYFVFAVKNKKQRRSLIKFAYLNYGRKDEFVWCPKKIQTLWSGWPEATKGQDCSGAAQEGDREAAASRKTSEDV